MPASEQNEVVFENIAHKDETNAVSASDSKNKTRKKLQIKILSSFVFLCATVVILQVGIYIPIFSEIFSPPVVVAQTTTPAKSYITNLVVNPPVDDYDSHYDKWYKMLDIHFDAGDSLTDYKQLVFELTFIGGVKETLYSKQTKAIVDSKAGYPRFIIEKDGTTYQCNLKVYCTTDNPEGIEFEEKKYLPGEEDMCYLIYKYDGIISY